MYIMLGPVFKYSFIIQERRNVKNLDGEWGGGRHNLLPMIDQGPLIDIGLTNLTKMMGTSPHIPIGPV